MEYRLPYQITALDYWKMIMRSIYQSFAGMVNVIFTLSMILVTYSFWEQVGPGLKFGLIILISLFTIIQPTAIYIRSKRMIDTIPDETEILINNEGIRVESNDDISEHRWKTVNKIITTRSMCVVNIGSNNGIVLSYKSMGSKKDEIVQFIQRCVENK